MGINQKTYYRIAEGAVLDILIGVLIIAFVFKKTNFLVLTGVIPSGNEHFSVQSSDKFLIFVEKQKK